MLRPRSHAEGELPSLHGRREGPAVPRNVLLSLPKTLGFEWDQGSPSGTLLEFLGKGQDRVAYMSQDMVLKLSQHFQQQELTLAKPGIVKTRSNSFHSTLEPNTEVFSKVSRSLAQFTLVNSVSTLPNKGGMSCNCPRASQDFFVNQNKQASAQLLCSSLVLSRHERSEGRRNSCEAEKAHLLRATRTSSRMSQGRLWCLALIMANSNMPSMPKPCHKHAKVMSQTCQGSCQCLFR